MQTVVHALAAAGLEADRLELEITELVLLEDTDHNTAILHQLRTLGVRIAMDDFGTGYSSLRYLQSFPFDKIKIDQTFIRDLSVRPDSLAIVKLIISMGSTLGMTTTAEGVETEAEFMQLQEAGSTEAQGYYFGKPQPAADAARLHCCTIPADPRPDERRRILESRTAWPAKSAFGVGPPIRFQGLAPRGGIDPAGQRRRR